MMSRLYVNILIAQSGFMSGIKIKKNKDVIGWMNGNWTTTVKRNYFNYYSDTYQGDVVIKLSFYDSVNVSALLQVFSWNVFANVILFLYMYVHI